MATFLALLGVGVALLICILIFLAVLPIYAGTGLFVNKPQGLMRSGFHLFTTLEPGQVKVIERGKKLIRMVTNTAHKKFARVGIVESPEYWDLIDATNESENPVADVWFPLRWWAEIVYQKTGLVFTGIYPFQRVREYELERTEVERNEVQSTDGTPSNLLLTVKNDMSDHFRTREFLYPMHITAAETADKIPLDIIGVAEMEVVNPHKAAYGTDRWDQKVVNLVTDTITRTTKQMKLDHALTATSEAEAGKIQAAVAAIKEDTEVCGIQINGFKILEINPVLDAEGFKAIQAEAIALQRGKATRIDGEARADALTSVNKANETGGVHAIETMQAEAFVRASEAASKGGGTVILMPAGRNETDPTQAAILSELKKLNGSK